MSWNSLSRKLIEISTLGEISVLGVKLDMKEETAAKILKPSSSYYWELEENAQKDRLIITNYHKDKEIDINFSCYDEKTKTSCDRIIDISISRTLTKDKLERDQALKYYTDQFKPYLKNSIIHRGNGFFSTDLLYDLGLNKAKISIGQWDMKDGRWYGILIEIEGVTKEEYVDNNIIKNKEGKYPIVGCLLPLMTLICGIILIEEICHIEHISTKEVSQIVTLALFISGIAAHIILKKEDRFKELSIRQKNDAIAFVKEVKVAENKSENNLLANIKHYESLLEQEKKKWLSEQQSLYNKKQLQLHEWSKLLEKKDAIIQERERRFEDILKSSLFKYSASLYADYKEREIEEIEWELKLRDRHPIKCGGKTDLILQELKKSKKEDVAKYKEILYKWEFLIKTFPELEDYVDDDELLSQPIYEDIEDLQNDYDRAKFYVSKEEYERMPVDARNQLALDRWWKQPCGVEEAGKRYELYCGYCFEKKGYKVEYHGIKEGKNDLGIDLIATKDGKTLIIQCKRRKQEGKIHHNTICQLFGSTIWHAIHENKEINDIKPVLMTSGQLDETAKEMAEILDIEVCYKPMGIYPIIKCNINNGNKIYHLPFDQQYNNTIIEPKKGEFYALTVEEATKAGFRRAFKHYIN